MNKLLDIVGISAALVGVLICLVAGVVRLAGNYHILGYEAITLFIGGISIMTMACLIKLYRPNTG